jgi:hypothetical protein
MSALNATVTYHKYFKTVIQHANATHWQKRF